MILLSFRFRSLAAISSKWQGEGSAMRWCIHSQKSKLQLNVKGICSRRGTANEAKLPEAQRNRERLQVDATLVGSNAAAASIGGV